MSLLSIGLGWVLNQVSISSLSQLSTMNRFGLLCWLLSASVLCLSGLLELGGAWQDMPTLLALLSGALGLVSTVRLLGRHELLLSTLRVGTSLLQKGAAGAASIPSVPIFTFLLCGAQLGLLVLWLVVAARLLAVTGVHM